MSTLSDDIYAIAMDAMNKIEMRLMAASDDDFKATVADKQFREIFTEGMFDPDGYDDSRDFVGFPVLLMFDANRRGFEYHMLVDAGEAATVQEGGAA